jgi:Sulfotransferase domain
MICDELCAAMLCDYDYTNTSKLEERYAQHYKTLGQLGEGRILRYRVQEGWGSLCKFLSVSVPDRPFPRQNDSGELKELGRQAWWTAVRNSVRNVIGGAVVILVMSMALAVFAN